MHSIYIGQLLWPAAAPFIVCMHARLGGVAIMWDYPHPVGALAPGRKCLHQKLFHPDHLWVQWIQIISLAYGRVWVSSPPHGIPATEPAFIERQKEQFVGPCHLPKFWGKKPKATTKMTLASHQLKFQMRLVKSGNNGSFFANCQIYQIS